MLFTGLAVVDAAVVTTAGLVAVDFDGLAFVEATVEEAAVDADGLWALVVDIFFFFFVESTQFLLI